MNFTFFLKERVALKKLKVGGNLDDFLKEAKILCSLDHPCIVKVYGVCYEFKIIVTFKLFSLMFFNIFATITH